MGFQEVTHRGDAPQPFQVARHHGLASGPIHLRHESKVVSSDAPRTMQLARPPAWTEHPDRPCELDRPRTPEGWETWPWDADRHVGEKRAKALCEGCPVLQECLDAAMLEETDRSVGRATFGNPLGVQHRYGIRGGLNPRGRAELAGAVPELKVGGLCVKGLHERTEDNQAIHDHGGLRGFVQACLPCLATRNRENRAKKSARREEAAA